MDWNLCYAMVLKISLGVLNIQIFLNRYNAAAHTLREIKGFVIRYPNLYEDFHAQSVQSVNDRVWIE